MFQDVSSNINRISNMLWSFPVLFGKALCDANNCDGDMHDSVLFKVCLLFGFISVSKIINLAFSRERDLLFFLQK